MAFGDEGKRKKTMFEKLTLLIVIVMLLASLLGIFATAIGALSNL
ncbi:MULTISPECIES: DUF4044 domain-containing protein [Streptococcus]|jgi:hypothetical protein|uniref:DUF4044 domain-containing protein n=3 Tax=Streptococcus TaxID=1301 RepID=A0A139PRE8_STROR|nr:MULTISPECIES: DUF4044 domain-containing protein [Streptococcus]KXT92760.1 hypothetical protein SORDD21_00309 [Streptococcus oralis]MCY7075229.1 DUF4044 domain-containing protein [Streptococcus oralis]ORO75722.1 DUF4044 domain-containing protein [Streptococcus oralis subsp. dentisani]RSI78214.1 hypothetical protein D8856_04330 [Streptococcus mitis]RXX23372.1 DUF4044 domain-containing protein [Streptococcus oralis]